MTIKQLVQKAMYDALNYPQDDLPLSFTEWWMKNKSLLDDGILKETKEDNNPDNRADRFAEYSGHNSD